MRIGTEFRSNLLMFFSHNIVRLQEGPHMICQANMYKSNARQSLRTSQNVQNALLNNKGIWSDHMGSLLQSDSVRNF